MRILWQEGKSRPFSTIAMMFMLLAVPYVYHNAASAQEVALIKKSLTDLAATYKIGLLEQKLQATETELFNTERRISEARMNRKYIDPINFDRLRDLGIEKGRLERKLTYVRTYG